MFSYGEPLPPSLTLTPHFFRNIIFGILKSYYSKWVGEIAMTIIAQINKQAVDPTPTLTNVYIWRMILPFHVNVVYGRPLTQKLNKVNTFKVCLPNENVHIPGKFLKAMSFHLRQKIKFFAPVDYYFNLFSNKKFVLFRKHEQKIMNFYLKGFLPC